MRAFLVALVLVVLAAGGAAAQSGERVLAATLENGLRVRLSPQTLNLVAIMSDTKIDFTHAVMPGGVVEVHLRVIMASCKLVVPPNVRVINETHSVMSSVRTPEASR